MKNSTYKTATVIREYSTRYGGYDIVVPIGAIVSNSTACGTDDNYRFWVNYHIQCEKLTGFKNSILAHDLAHYGLNIPKKYCSNWTVDKF